MAAPLTPDGTICSPSVQEGMVSVMVGAGVLVGEEEEEEVREREEEEEERREEEKEEEEEEERVEEEEEETGRTWLEEVSGMICGADVLTSGREVDKIDPLLWKMHIVNSRDCKFCTELQVTLFSQLCISSSSSSYSSCIVE